MVEGVGSPFVRKKFSQHKWVSEENGKRMRIVFQDERHPQDGIDKFWLYE